jgi:alpha/beta superfamily hydrolase
MKAQTLMTQLAGPAGPLQCAVDEPAQPARGTAIIAHPHPLHGGTMDNKVVQTLARAYLQMGLRTVRFNFRGIGQSGGQWDEGRGEIEDMAAVVAHHRESSQALALAGFSFGAYVASHVADRLHKEGAALAWPLVLVGPAVSRFSLAPVAPGTLIIHGEQDDVVALADVMDWARPQQQAVTVVPGAGHFFHGMLPLLKNLVLQSGQAENRE